MSWVKKARWGESGFWLSPDGVLVNFAYPAVQHAEAIDEGLLGLSPQEQEQLEKSESPVEDLVRRGWARGIVNPDEVYVQVADESRVDSALSHLPFLAPKLFVDADLSNNSDEGYFALLLNEGEDLLSAWRNRNRPRVYASLRRPRRNPWPKHWVSPRFPLARPARRPQPAMRPRPTTTR